MNIEKMAWSKPNLQSVEIRSTLGNPDPGSDGGSAQLNPNNPGGTS